jgi:hypothetical protein
MKKWLQHPIIPFLFVLLISLGLFQRKLGWDMLKGAHYSWLQITPDSYTEYLSWEFYRRTPLRFPVLGTMEKYDYPSKSGIGVTGAIPIMAIPLKLVNAFLPERFQHLGWWMLLNYMLLGIFGVLFLKAIGIRYPLWLVLGATLFMISPAFITRSGHLALCAHWVLIWAFWIYYVEKDIAQQYRMTLWNVGIASLVQPYLLAMAMGVHVATLWKGVIAKSITTRKALFYCLGYLPVIAFCWFIAGNFNIPLSSNSAEGYGIYSANLNVLWNSLGFAQVFPAFPWANSGQHEGYSYLGAGAIFLFSGMLMYHVFKTKLTFQPIWVIAGLSAFYALSNIITFNEHIVFQYFGFPKFITDTFRGSARFIWLLHYLLIFMGIKYLFDSRLPIWAKHFIFVAAFSLQLYDLKEFFYPDQYKSHVYTPKIEHQVWSTITKGAARLVMYPPYGWNYGQEYDFLDFANVAVENNMDFTAAYLARNDKKARNRYRESLNLLLAEGSLVGEENSIFITTPENAPTFKLLYEKGMVRAFSYQNRIIVVPVQLKTNIDYLESELDLFPPFIISPPTAGTVE